MWKRAFKDILRDTVCLSRPYPLKVFKGCLPQILLGQFLNTLSHIILKVLKNCKLVKFIECHFVILFENCTKTDFGQPWPTKDSRPWGSVFSQLLLLLSLLQALTYMNNFKIFSGSPAQNHCGYSPICKAAITP